MSKRLLARAAAGMVAIAGMVGFAGAPAKAASVAGDCVAGGFAGWGVAYYSLSGGYTYWERFALEQLRAGPKTTAFVRVRNETTGSDQIVWGPSQVHDLRHDTPKNHDPAATIRTPNAQTTYASFQFRFDKDGFDSECTARTPGL